jgi:TonB family protein
MDRILHFTASVILLLAVQRVVSQSQTTGNSSNGAASPATSTGAFRVGGAVSAPLVISSPDPEYSNEGLFKKIEGTCVLWLVVNTEGKPQNIRVQHTLGYGLDEKAIEAVKHWRFKPAQKDGKPVAVQINVEVSFRLYGHPITIHSTTSDVARLQERANAGDMKAQVKLAEAYIKGEGVRQSDNEGYRLLKDAAEHGLPEAQFKLGEYIFGHGYRSGDYIAAYTWYAIAKQNKYKHSEQRLKEVAAKMSAEDIAEAQERVQVWRPTQ